MEMVSEITARLENKPGRLAKICSALAQEKVDILAISVMESDGPSVLRLVTADPDATRRILTGLGTESTVAEVLSIQIDNRTGALAGVLEKLAEEHINVDYAYVSSTSSQGKALAILHVANLKRAQQVFRESTAPGSDKAAGRRPLHSR
ncbi:ACT domain-containing protein [Paludisphaera sp.]|uniref:ACT domain-containing protein n=1 Tax=Paludisphaera sp. TaxID=2017432 RepID=UPI00301D4A4F